MKTAKIHRRPSLPPFDPAITVARRYRLPIATARLICELAGIGAKHLDIDIVGGGATR